MKRISFVFGTRPEAIKLCPLVQAFRARRGFAPHVCVTGQHREMLDQVLDLFEVRPEVDLALMQPNQSLSELSARSLTGISGYLSAYKPDLVIVQGDTTTAFIASLVAFYHRIPVGHVEAGLRTWNYSSPFPEEINRVLTSRLADYHFAPTTWARDNLLREGVPDNRVFVTGNTIIDALRIAVGKAERMAPEISGFNSCSTRPIVLITGHRRENFGAGFEAICLAIATLSHRFPETDFVYPVHLNPNVREPVFRILNGCVNVHLIEPLGYLSFVALMQRSRIVLTDSGGVQEEAPGLGKPVLVMRDTTERPEAVDAGTVRLVGSDTGRIVEGVTQLLTDGDAYAVMARAINPYGDGCACERITQIVGENL